MSAEGADGAATEAAVATPPTAVPVDEIGLSTFKQIQLSANRHKTARIATVGVIALGSLWIVCNAAVRLFEAASGDPPWLKVIELTLAIAAPATVPAVIAWKVAVRFKLFVKNHTGRVIELESTVDAGRSSSGIQSDGSAEHD